MPGVQALARGVMPYVDALDRAEARGAGVTTRFNLDALYDAAGTRQVAGAATRMTGADQGFNGDVIAPGFATSGAPSTLVRSPYAVARGPAIVYLDIGINDVRANRTAAQVIADLDRQVSALTSYGIWVVLQTMTYPKDGGQAAYAAAVPAINAWIKAQAARARVKICDTVALDGTPGAPAANFGGDLLHLSPAGARARALVLWPLLQSMVGSSTSPAVGVLDAATNLWPLRGQPGTSGTATNASGQVATGYNLTRSTGASTYTGSKETIAAGDDWQVVTVTPNGAAGTGSFSLRPTAQYTYAALGLAAGDWYELSVTVRLDGWAGWEVANGDAQTGSLYAEASDSTIATVYASYSNLAAMPGRTVQLSIKGKVPTSGDRFRWSNRMVQIFHRTDVGGTGVAKIGEPVLRKIGDPGPAWGL